MSINIVRIKVLALMTVMLTNFATAQQSIKMLQIYIQGKNDKVVAQTIQQYQGLGTPPLSVIVEVITLDVYNALTSLDQNFSATDPLSGATSNSRLRDYDIIFFGISDSYAMTDLTVAGASQIRNFAKLGKGIIFSHDTAFWSESGQNFSTLGDVTGMKGSEHIGIMFTEVANVATDKSAAILRQPFVLPEKFNVTSTHQTHQGVADGTLWYASNNNGQPYLVTYLNPGYQSRSVFINYGHLQQAPPEYEAKTLINSIYFANRAVLSEMTNLIIEKTSWSPAPAMAGDPITFELLIKNAGNKKWIARDLVVNIRAIDFRGTGPDDSFWLKVKSDHYAQIRENDQKLIRFSTDLEPGQSITKKFETTLFAADYIDGLEIELMPGIKGGSVDDDPSGNIAEPRFQLDFGSEPYINCLNEVLTGLTHGIVNLTAACHTVMAINHYYDYGPSFIYQSAAIADNLKKDEFAEAGEETIRLFFQVYSDMAEELAGRSLDCGGTPLTNYGKLSTVLSFLDAAMNEWSGRGCGAALVHEAIKIKNMKYKKSLLESFNQHFCKYFNIGATCAIVASPANLKITHGGKTISIAGNGNRQVDYELGTAYLFGELKCALVMGDQISLIELQGIASGTVDLIIIKTDHEGSNSTWQFEKIPVTAATKAKMTIESTSSDPALWVDETGDGVYEKSFQPTSDELVDIPIVIADESGANKELHLGLHPNASNGIDASLMEEELPPFPVSGVFEARLVGQHIDISELGEGTYRDFRRGDMSYIGQTIHEIRFQPASGHNATLSWHLPSNVTGLLEDLVGGVVLHQAISGSGSTTISNADALQYLKIVLTYGPTKPKEEFEFPITVSDGSGATKELKIGLLPTATDGIDSALGEEELPPIPPQGIFDARLIGTDVGLDFGQGVDKDMRKGSSDFKGILVYEIQFQPSSGKNITIYWNLPFGVTGILEDLFGGALIKQNMSKTGNYQVTNNAINKLKMTITYDLVTGIFRDTPPVTMQLLQNYPNPFNPTTFIGYRLADAMAVQIAIFDINGRKVKTLIDRFQTPGAYTIAWDGTDENGKLLASGLYFYQMTSDGYKLVRPMVYMK